ncbi:FAD-dependent oxidoreductase [Plantactinospora soyae]|uniref:3-(3-hydroxy-phenyl)propionate hydroxylase n=1 Tax=Plantactinospora soyae TaxID=1544732 RepID=A0A927QUE7_9ACTN|nr:NAD(P)/FAD-dependent oxidoreductase [Plantactinospora soyae]MBE1484470.1 3-(3-hydroxy-phenyl)propionate hydroxylase [Plantactinospora soyae]
MSRTIPTAATAPVLVVGAGPVGVTAAAELVRHGVPVVLIEAESEPKTDWRASTFHPPTLELLDELGIVDRMIAEGLVVPRFQHRDRDAGLVAEFDFGLLRDETAHPYRLQLNQQHLVRMLVERLRGSDLAREVFGARVTGVRETDGGVSVTVRTQSGETEIHGSHLIGADGANSTVRQSLDIGFEGHTYPERFLIVSTSVDLREMIPGLADVNYVADPREWLFLLHTRESWRAVYPVPPDQPREVALDPDTLQAQLQGIAPRAEGYPIVDRQIYNVHQRVASTFRLGNVVVVGDAAHINSPVGGVGLNSGIHDAMDVVRRLVRIRAGADAEPELAAFDAVRRRVALDYVQADTHRNTERLKETDPERRRANQDELRAIAADPVRHHAWVRRASLLESVRRFGIARVPDVTASGRSGPNVAASGQSGPDVAASGRSGPASAPYDAHRAHRPGAVPETPGEEDEGPS